jgi:putative membrane protein
MSGVQEIFTPEAEAEIRTAVDRAEKGTAGEIVPYVVNASDSYEGALWKGAAMGAMVASVTAAGSWLLWQPWGAPVALWLAAPPLVGAAVGYLAGGALPALRRALIGQEVMSRRVERRAGIAFLEEEVFRTRDRTGILLFLSLFERRVVVLGDEGINSKVAETEWRGIVSRMVAGIKADRAVSALVGAIDECGLLLERRGVEIRPDDENELSDELRSRDR